MKLRFPNSLQGYYPLSDIEGGEFYNSVVLLSLWRRILRTLCYNSRYITIWFGG